MRMHKVLIVAALVCWSGVASAQQNEVVLKCTDDPTNPTTAEYTTCAALSAGSSSSTPTYTVLRDGNGTYLLDVEPMGTAAGAAEYGVNARCALNGWDGAALQLIGVNEMDTAPGISEYGLNTHAMTYGWDGAAPQAIHAGDANTAPANSDQALSVHAVVVGDDGSALQILGSNLMNATPGNAEHGLNTLSLSFGWDGSALQPVGIGDMSVAPATSDQGFNVRAGLIAYDGSAFRFLNSNLMNATPAVTEYGVNTLSLTFGWDGSALQAIDAGDASTSPGNTDQVLSTSAVLNAYDGTNIELVYGSDASSDGKSSATTGLVMNSRLFLYNGATWDRAPSSSTGALSVGVEAWPNAVDESNGWVNERVYEIATTEPAQEGPTTVADTSISASSGQVVLTSRDALKDASWCVYLRNAGGGSGDDLADAEIQTSVDGTNWTDNIVWTACDSLVSGATCTYCSKEAYKYIQVKAACASGEDTTVVAQYVGRKI